MRFAEGEPEGDLAVVGPTDGASGTQVNFLPSSSVFSRTEFDLATLDPLVSDGYYNHAQGLTGKLSGDQITLYLAPDVDGTDDQFIIITRHTLDPSIIVVAVHTNIIAAAGGWIDGVYIVTEDELAEADEI